MRLPPSSTARPASRAGYDRPTSNAGSAGSNGVAVPGYELKILDDAGAEVQVGTPGALYGRGASAATGYWSRYDASRQVFQGEWLRTGDTYIQDDSGYYTCLGRTGDMLKVSGIWLSPAEVEERLLAHQTVAYVMLRPGALATEDELIQFCRAGLPTLKRPRRVVFTDAYPTTATGKIRRVELRQMATALLAENHRLREPAFSQPWTTWPDANCTYAAHVRGGPIDVDGCL